MLLSSKENSLASVFVKHQVNQDSGVVAQIGRYYYTTVEVLTPIMLTVEHAQMCLSTFEQKKRSSALGKGGKYRERGESPGFGFVIDSMTINPSFEII